MTNFKKMADEQRARINAALQEAEPGSDVYDKLLKQRMALEEIESKRQNGRIEPKDWFKIASSIIVTGGILTADAWIPSVASKLKLSEFVSRLIK